MVYWYYIILPFIFNKYTFKFIIYFRSFMGRNISKLQIVW
nr:MAG TPA: hypothetical protein [Crassvirales sp.]